MDKSAVDMARCVPDDLARSIREGRCVAFIGAGFSQPLLPSWHELLRLLAATVDDHELRAWLDQEKLSHRDYEGIAQTIHTALGDSFEERLCQIVDPERRLREGDPSYSQDREIVDNRIEWLRGIPFHSVLTTNFDTLLPGLTPSTETYAEVIGAPRRPWWSHQAWSESGDATADHSWKAPVMKLHGDLCASPGASNLVFTTRGYRRLVHERPGYRAFLRTLFATHSILYMGFSFSDAYINELRSEILAWIGRDRGGRRLQDYAILADVPSRVAHHLREYEGLECLSFDTGGRKDFSGFDEWLRAVYERTSPEATLRARVKGKRILWFDPAPKNNLFGHEVLLGSTGLGGACAVTPVTTVEEAIAALGYEDKRYDLLISHFGFYPDEPPNVQRLVEYMRKLPFRRHVPVLVFSEKEHRHLNRPLALRLGVFDYVDDWATLFEAIERIFESEAPASAEGSKESVEPSAPHPLPQASPTGV